MTNVLERAINTDDPDRAAKIIQHVLGTESDEVATAKTFHESRWPNS